MGDGYHDAAILKQCRYGIAPVMGAWRPLRGGLRDFPRPPGRRGAGRLPTHHREILFLTPPEGPGERVTMIQHR